MLYAVDRLKCGCVACGANRLCISSIIFAHKFWYCIIFIYTILQQINKNLSCQINLNNNRSRTCNYIFTSFQYKIYREKHFYVTQHHVYPLVESAIFHTRTPLNKINFRTSLYLIFENSPKWCHTVLKTQFLAKIDPSDWWIFLRTSNRSNNFSHNPLLDSKKFRTPYSNMMTSSLKNVSVIALFQKLKRWKITYRLRINTVSVSLDRNSLRRIVLCG